MSSEPNPLARLTERLSKERREVHSRVIGLVEDLTDEQLRWRPGANSPAIGFHVWHLARWADHDWAQFKGNTQIWEAEGLASAWGLTSCGLGKGDTGTEMGDEQSAQLVLPSKAALVNYARSAFAALDDFLTRVPVESQLRTTPAPEYGGRTIDAFVYVTHDNRHLGMIEALRGMLGLQGTATN